MPPIGRRLLAGLGLVTLLTGAATPIAAARTLRVDDDGRASATSCDGTRRVSRSIQKTIDASGAFDTILVCPGTYAGHLNISGSAHRGLALRSVRVRRATIVGDGAPNTVNIGSNRVTLDGFKLRLPTDVTNADDAILVIGRNAVVRRNHLLPGSGDALGGPGGFQHGITVDLGGSATIAGNIVERFKLVGILVHTDSSATVVDNQVRFWHPLLTAAQARRLQPALATEPNGIRVYLGSGLVRGNTVSSTAGADDPLEQMDFGVTVVGNGVVVGPDVRNNVIRRAQTGIRLFIASNGAVTGNDVRAGLKDGIVLDNSTGVLVRRNEVHGFAGAGILADAVSTGNTFDENDAQGNGALDCHDKTGDALPLDNVWTQNLGLDDSPDGICSAS